MYLIWTWIRCISWYFYPIQPFFTWLLIYDSFLHLLPKKKKKWDSYGDNRIKDLKHDEKSSSLKRSRTFVIWDQFDHIVDEYGTSKARCRICIIKFANRASSNTSNMKSHLEKCPPHKKIEKKKVVPSIERCIENWWLYRLSSMDIHSLL